MENSFTERTNERTTIDDLLGSWRLGAHDGRWRARRVSSWNSAQRLRKVKVEGRKEGGKEGLAAAASLRPVAPALRRQSAVDRSELGAEIVLGAGPKSCQLNYFTSNSNKNRYLNYPPPFYLRRSRQVY